MKRRNGLRELVVVALEVMAEANVELFHARDVAQWAGIDANSSLSNILADLAKEHGLVVTRYSELNGNRGKIYAFNESYVNANMHKGAR